MAKVNNVGSTSGEWADFGLTHLRFDVCDDGIAVALIDVQGETMNVLGQGLADDLELVLTRVRRDPSIRALVLGSAKGNGFLAGADIKMLERQVTKGKKVDVYF